MGSGVAAGVGSGVTSGVGVSIEPAGGVGMTIPSPTLIWFGFLIDGFAASSPSTVTPNRWAIFENVSPFATTYVWGGGDGWAVVPAVGIVMEGGAGVGLAVIGTVMEGGAGVGRAVIEGLDEPQPATRTPAMSRTMTGR
jgi:hypothetical protein